MTRRETFVVSRRSASRRNWTIRDSEGFGGEQLRKFVKDHPAEGSDWKPLFANVLSIDRS